MLSPKLVGGNLLTGHEEFLRVKHVKAEIGLCVTSSTALEMDRPQPAVRWDAICKGKSKMPDVHAAMVEQFDPQASAETQALTTALSDAARVLDYAIGRGLLSPSGSDVGSMIVTDLVQAQVAARSGTLTTDTVIAFWMAYARLAHLVRPVTAKSLEACQRVSLTGMKVLAFVLVCGIILFSIFLFMCNATLNETSDLIDQQNTAALKLWSDVQVMRANGDLNRQSDGVMADHVFTEMVEFSRKNVWLLQSSSRLNFWFIPPWMRLSIDDVVFNASNRNRLDHLNVPPDLSTPTQVVGEAIHQIKAYQYLRDYSLGLYKIDSLVYNSLSTYFLPTVYALLGAFLYGFRFYSRLIKRNEYLPSVANSARYYIASIAGLVVGLFGTLLPKGMGMPPLAAAFLVGYAVEMFFSRLDALIRKLKGVDAAPVARPKPATTAPSS
jgi:hypothetical protein